MHSLESCFFYTLCMERSIFEALYAERLYLLMFYKRKAGFFWRSIGGKGDFLWLYMRKGWFVWRFIGGHVDFLVFFVRKGRLAALVTDRKHVGRFERMQSRFAQVPRPVLSNKVVAKRPNNNLWTCVPWWICLPLTTAKKTSKNHLRSPRIGTKLCQNGERTKGNPII